MKKRIVLILLLINIIFIGKIQALDVSVYTGNGSGAGSASCTMGYCTGIDKNYYGIKVTFMKKNQKGVLVKVSSLPLSIDNGPYYLVSSAYKQAFPNRDDVIQYDGLPSELGENTAPNEGYYYPTYLGKDNLKANSNAELKNILKTINSNFVDSNNEFNPTIDFSGYYLKIEPLLKVVLRDNQHGHPDTPTVYAFYGTPHGIAYNAYNYTGYLDKVSNAGNLLTDIGKSFTVISNVSNGDGNYKCYIFDDLEKYTFKELTRDTNPCNQINGEWNVLRNFFTKLRINTTEVKPYIKKFSDSELDKVSGYAFYQIHNKSVYGKTLIKLSEFVPTCSSEFNSSDKSMAERYRLYKKYGSRYNNLFNLNIEDGSQACSNNPCSSNSTKACLSYMTNHVQSDYSCYDEMNTSADESTLNYLCNTNFFLINNIGLSSIPYFYISPNSVKPTGTTNFKIIPGMSIPGTDGVIGTATLQKRCYVVPKEGRNENDKDTKIIFNENYLNNFLDKIEFNGTSLDYSLYKIRYKNYGGEYENINDIYNPNIDKTMDKSEKKVNNIIVETATEGKYEVLKKYGRNVDNRKIEIDIGYYNEYIYFDYLLKAPEVLLKRGTGAKESNGSISSSQVRAVNGGIYTSYEFAKWNKASGNIPFNIKFKSGKGLSDYSTVNDNTSANQCTYNGDKYKYLLINTFSPSDPSNSSTPVDLNLEFREINTEKPFVNQNGLERKTMTNWCYDNSKINTSILNDEQKDWDETYKNQRGLESLSIFDATAINRIYSGMGSNFKDTILNNLDSYDLYKDGVLNNMDAIAIQQILDNQPDLKSCSSKNLLVKKVINEAPNSYGIKNLDGETSTVSPKYKIKITLELMETIKAYAKDNNITYKDFNLVCDNRDICTSKLLTFLNNNNNLTINYSTKR